MKSQSITQYAITGSLSLGIFALPYSLVFCHLGLAIFLVSSIAEGQWRTRIGLLLRNPIVFCFVLFFLLHVIGVFYSEDKSNSWFNVEKKISLILIPLALASREPMKGEELRWLLNLFIFSCFIATILCLVNAFDQYSGSSGIFSLKSLTSNDFYSENSGKENAWLFFSYDQLASGINIHPTYLSLYLAFCTLILFNFHARTFRSYTIKKRILLFLLFAYFGMFVILLSSRVITIAYLGITFWGTCVLIRGDNRADLRWIYSLVPVGALCCLIYLFPISRYRIIEEVAATPVSFYKPGLQTQSTGIRASLWWLGLKSIGEINPVWGAGPGDVKAIIRSTGEKTNIRNVLGTSDPHNQYLQTLIGLGILGLASFVLCLAIPGTIAWRQKDHFYLGFILLFAWTCMVESVLEVQKGIVFFAIFNSLLIFQRDNFRFESFKIAT